MEPRRTRVVHLEHHQAREQAPNVGTVISPVASARFRLAVGAAFGLAWPELREQLARSGQPGIVVVVVDAVRGALAGSLCLAAKEAQPNVAFLGRHGTCDLFLPDDPGLALRHLAFVIEPRCIEPQVRLRILDLRTDGGFADEAGRKLEAVLADGPLFVTAGRYAVFAMIAGDGASWPEDADAAWAQLPARVHLDERNGEPDPWRRRRPRHSRSLDPGPALVATPPPPRVTEITSVRGPAPLLLTYGSTEAVGELRLSGAAPIAVDAAALARGILLGRYERCDGNGIPTLAQSGISRVHLLVLAIADDVWAIDTASSNGTSIVGEDGTHRIMQLVHDRELVLGDNLVWLRWRKRPSP